MKIQQKIIGLQTLKNLIKFSCDSNDGKGAKSTLILANKNAANESVSDLQKGKF